MRRGYRVHPGRANHRAGRFSRQRYEPYPPYQPHYAPPPLLYAPPMQPLYVPPPVPAPVPNGNRKPEPRDQLTATLKMYCEDEIVERALNSSNALLSTATSAEHKQIGHTDHTATENTIDNIASYHTPAEDYQPDVQSDSDRETAEQLHAVQSTGPVQYTPVIQSPAPMPPRGALPVTHVTNALPSPVKVSPPRPAGHVPVVVPKKAVSQPKRPMTATIVNMTAQQKEIQLKLAPVQIVPYEGGKKLKFPYDPIEWPKTPKQYCLEWFQRQSSLRVNKNMALIDPQRAAAMSQVPKWEKVSAPALRQGLHLVTLHVTDPRTLQALTFTPDRYWSTIKEAEHVASLLFLQHLLPQANSAKEIHEAMENMQRHQKRLNNTTGSVPRKPGAVPAEKVGKEIYSAVPPTAQLTVSTRAPDAAPVKQFLDTRPHMSNASTTNPVSVNVPPPPHPNESVPYSGQGYYPMYQGYYYPQYYAPYPGYHYPYPPQ